MLRRVEFGVVPGIMLLMRTLVERCVDFEVQIQPRGRQLKGTLRSEPAFQAAEFAEG
jgi:hypothetical protein